MPVEKSAFVPPPPKPPAPAGRRSQPAPTPSRPPAARPSQPPPARPSHAPARASQPPPRATASAHTTKFPPLAVPVHPLVLAMDHGLDSRGTAAALEGGQNFVFVAGGAAEPALNVLKRALAEHRDRYVIATAPALGYFGGSFERSADRWRRVLGIDSIDVMFALGVGRLSSWSPGVVSTLEQLKARGTIKSIGAGLRSRKHARTLLESPVVDFLVVPYSAAHRGAETGVFPFVEAMRQAKIRTPTIIASQATSHRELLRPTAGYQGRVPTAAECYRFSLASRYVDLVFTGPRNLERAARNLADFEGAGPLGPHEVEWMAHFGDLVRKQEGGGE